MAEALDMAQRGWWVLPLIGKYPLTQNGVDDASTDPDLIRTWWRVWPGANLGARVPEKLIVIDVDPRNDGFRRLAGFVQQLGDLPPTLTVWSGRNDGGCHLYYRRPAGDLTSSRFKDPGVDVKLKGYCALPPSIHPETRGEYRWEQHPLADLPAGWAQALRPDLPRRRPLTVLRSAAGDREQMARLIEAVANAPRGKRNTALNEQAFRAATAGYPQEWVDLLEDAAVGNGLPRREAQRTIASAQRGAG